MEAQYVVFAAAWLAVVVVYVWLVVGAFREVRKATWISEAARTVWTLVVVLWPFVGPLAWNLYAYAHARQEQRLGVTSSG